MMNMKNRLLHPLVIALLLTGIAAIAYVFTFWGKSIIADTTKWSEFGGYIGGVLGPAFGLVSIYLLLDTLRLQKQTLAETQKFQVEQQRSSSKQSFEQTFFAWLHSFRDIVTTISYEFQNTSTGPSALKRIWDHWMSNDRISSGEHYAALTQSLQTVRNRTEGLNSSASDLLAEAVKAAFQKMYAAERHNIASMIRTLYRLIKWIDSSDLLVTEKHDYVGIARSQISSIELQFLFLNVLSRRGNKFSTLINKYALFDNLETDDPLFSFMRAWDGGRVLNDFAFNAEAARTADHLRAT